MLFTWKFSKNELKKIKVKFNQKFVKNTKTN